MIKALGSSQFWTTIALKKNNYVQYNIEID